MPAKGSKLKCGNRDYVFNLNFYKNTLVADKGIDLSYEQCRDIIEYSDHVVADVITEELDGFKLPFGLGYLCATTFIPKKPAINWKESNKLKKHVYFVNLHTEGKSVRVNWYRVGRVTGLHFNETFMFKSYSSLKEKVSDAFTNGKPYEDWTVDDFYDKGRLENLYNKKYRKELKQ